MSLQNYDSDGVRSKFEKDATEQYKTLMRLKQQHEEVGKETEQRIAELNTVQQIRFNLEDDIETHSIRIQKKEEVLAKVQATLKKLQEEANEIQKQIKKEKQEQIDSLKDYENKMASIADKLRSGPKFYDRKNIAAEMSSLQEETSAIIREMASVEEELNEYHIKYKAMFNESLDKSDTTGGCTLELSALQHLISQMAEDTQLYNSEDKRLCEELNNLSRMLNALEGDLKELQQGHSILK